MTILTRGIAWRGIGDGSRVDGELAGIARNGKKVPIGRAAEVNCDVDAALGFEDDEIFKMPSVQGEPP
jgi:hypothetical protein